ncbi:MAG: zinc ribbon domain-containing protein [Chloroflexi bacterium HGW-Chloroflexi-5]|nr:MAG: zinc ribbon domain-containing protein [Chloroflexi bacterium HGW-Chloroflexi-5]
MPIYEFICNDCKKCFDKLCSLKDDLRQVKCEFCSSSDIRKKMSAFATTRDENEHDSHAGSSCSSCSSGSCSTCGH